MPCTDARWERLASFLGSTRRRQFFHISRSNLVSVAYTSMWPRCSASPALRVVMGFVYASTPTCVGPPSWRVACAMPLALSAISLNAEYGVISSYCASTVLSPRVTGCIKQLGRELSPMGADASCATDTVCVGSAGCVGGGRAEGVLQSV